METLTIARIVCVPGIYIILAHCTFHTDRYVGRGEDILNLPEVYNILTQSTQHKDTLALGDGILYVSGDIHHTKREYTNRYREPGGRYFMCILGIHVHHTDQEYTTLRYSDIACVHGVNI